MLICSECGSPALELLGLDELDKGYKWKEKYRCEDCGAEGTKKIDDNPELRKPEVKLKGSIEWEEEI